MNDLAENVALSCELLWVVMQLDIKRLQNRVDNSEELATETNEYLKRMVREKNIDSVLIMTTYQTLIASNESRS